MDDEQLIVKLQETTDRSPRNEGRIKKLEGENAVLHQLATKVDDWEDKPAKRKIPAEAIQAPKIGAAREVAD